MSQVYIFRNRISSCNYVFEDGTVANFVGGIYTTDDPMKAQELQNLVDGVQKKRDNKGNEVFNAAGENVWAKTSKHPHIYQDEGVKTIDSAQLDPLWAIKEKLREELRAEMGLVDPNRDMGNYEQGNLNPTSTQDIASASTGGSGARSISIKELQSQLLKAQSIQRTGDPEPNPNAVPNSEAAPGNAISADLKQDVAGVKPSDALAALMAAQAATKNSITGSI
jgi:hypothetical protein